MRPVSEAVRAVESTATARERAQRGWDPRLSDVRGVVHPAVEVAVAPPGGTRRGRRPKEAIPLRGMRPRVLTPTELDLPSTDALRRLAVPVRLLRAAVPRHRTAEAACEPLPQPALGRTPALDRPVPATTSALELVL